MVQNTYVTYAHTYIYFVYGTTSLRMAGYGKFEYFEEAGCE